MVAPLVLCAQTENSMAGPGTSGTSTSSADNGNESNQSKSPGIEQAFSARSVQTNHSGLSGIVGEILKMFAAKVSPEIIKAYVEGAPIGNRPTAEEIVALKAQGVPDDITSALLKRATEVRLEIQRAEEKSAASLRGTPTQKPGNTGNTVVYVHGRPMDPESYEYFQYYYLHPRTLASVYQRLSPYYPRSFGYNPPLPYDFSIQDRRMRHPRSFSGHRDWRW